MAHQTHVRSLSSFHGYTVRPNCPTSTSIKIKTILQAYIYRHICHVVAALASAKSMIVDLLKRKKNTTITTYSVKLWKEKEEEKKKKKKKKKGIFDGAMRMHLNWSSSYVNPMPEPSRMEAFDVSHAYYDSTWNSMISCEDRHEDMNMMEPQLSGYLTWLEEKGSENLDDEANEIDRLAEKFIASFHEKFRLEKQESYRRYLDMLARST